MRVLVVEDEIRTGPFLQQGLTEAGFSVDLAIEGSAGFMAIRATKYDLVILDINLPGLNGWQILEAARASGIAVPILVLTARDSVEDRVRGLELGADDYLIKPFAFSELLARIRTLARRHVTQAHDPNVLRHSDLELNIARRVARKGDILIHLTGKEAALLELFLRRPGEILTRSYIASAVWDMTAHADTNVVDVSVRRLRAKIDEAFALKLLHTVRGIGYVLEER